MSFPRNEFEAWALPHFSGGDAEAIVALSELDSKGGYRSTEMRAAWDSWQRIAEQRDALAAHMERISERARVITDSRAWEGNADPRVPHALLNRLSEACMDAPSTALVQRDARVAAKALEKARSQLSMAETAESCVAHLDRLAGKYRRQAEEAR